MNYPIKFAGLYFNWDSVYARSYSNKLQEMGFHTKILNFMTNNIVAYSYRSFSKNEAQGYLNKIMEREKKGDRQTLI